MPYDTLILGHFFDPENVINVIFVRMTTKEKQNENEHFHTSSSLCDNLHHAVSFSPQGNLS